MNRPKRSKLSPSAYHGTSTNYRNIAVPNALHKRVAHVAIDLEISISEIASVLLTGFCERFESGQFDMEQWQQDLKTFTNIGG